jgi:hypothetical protein
MTQSLGGCLTFLACLGLTGPAVAADAGWQLEKDVARPSYAVIDPATSDLNIDAIVLSCEQGPNRRGMQLRLFLSGAGPLAPKGARDLKAAPRLELAVDGVSRAADLLFADDFVVVADGADGAMPLLSEDLVDELQAGRRLELRFDLVDEPRGQAPSFDGTAVVDLQAGEGGSAIAALRHCGGDSRPQVAESARRSD